MSIPLARFTAESDVLVVPGGFDLTVHIRGLAASPKEERELLALAWMHLSRSLQRRGCNLDQLVRSLPNGR